MKKVIGKEIKEVYFEKHGRKGHSVVNGVQFIAVLHPVKDIRGQMLTT